jgi:hypothetical protein
MRTAHEIHRDFLDAEGDSRLQLEIAGEACDTLFFREKELEDLRKRDELLTALQNGGVDNWDGYAWAIEEYKEEVGYEL